MSKQAGWELIKKRTTWHLLCDGNYVCSIAAGPRARDILEGLRLLAGARSRSKPQISGHTDGSIEPESKSDRAMEQK